MKLKNTYNFKFEDNGKFMASGRKIILEFGTFRVLTILGVVLLTIFCCFVARRDFGKTFTSFSGLKTYYNNYYKFIL